MASVSGFGRWARRAIIGLPYAWLLLFFLLPFAIVVKISFAEALIAVPPYTELLRWIDGRLQLGATIENYLFLFTDKLYVLAYLNSLKIAAVSTLVCLLIGYPMAWAIARSSPSTRNVLLLLVVLPSWTSFLIRVYAWMGILSNTGYLNSLFTGLGLVDSPVQMLRTDLAVYIGIVYTYLPFMVLPIYTNLVRLDYSLVEAARDLGAPPWRCMLQIVLPLSSGGIIAGCMLVFIPATGEFIIPELLGGADTLMIGKVLWQEFFNNRDWPVASAVAILLLLILLVPIAIYYRQHAPGTAAAAVDVKQQAPEARA
ncbi:MAG: ABC transporter permease subunit [Gammaproteobacteria bacterium]|nr:ABC transporter permease subunit [Gammaproteobacteria bacterium]